MLINTITIMKVKIIKYSTQFVEKYICTRYFYIRDKDIFFLLDWISCIFIKPKIQLYILLKYCLVVYIYTKLKNQLHIFFSKLIS